MPDITKGKTFESGDRVTATSLNSLVDEAVINNLAINNNKLAADAVTNIKVSDAAAIDWAKMAALTSGQILVGNSDNLAAGVAMSGDATISNTGVVTLDPNAIMPSGSITQYAGSSAPTGWLICDGTEVPEIHSDLDTLLDNQYGTGGNGRSLLPDLRGRMPMGVGQGNTAEGGTTGTSRSLADIGGAERHTLTEAEMPAHNHGIRESAPGTTTGVNDYAVADGASSAPNIDDNAIQNTGGGGSHNITSPFLVVNFIIKT